MGSVSAGRAALYSTSDARLGPALRFDPGSTGAHSVHHGAGIMVLTVCSTL